MKISGQVVDVDNVPLASANVTLRSGLKSGKIGTSADFDGKFSLESDNFTEKDVFEVSYVGFTSQNLPLKNYKIKK